MISRDELYTELDKVDSEDKQIFSKLSYLNDKPQFKEDENLKAFELLVKISTLHEAFEKGFPKFSPMWVLSDGRRTFSVEDMTDEDFDTLSSLDLMRLPIALAVRVADLLWFKRKNRDAAQFSIDNYYKLYLSSFDYDNWLDS